MRPDVNHFLQSRRRMPVVGDIRNRLRELSAEAEPPYGWVEFRDRSLAQAARKGQRVRWWPHAAAAAGLAGLVAGMALLGNVGSSNETIEPSPDLQNGIAGNAADPAGASWRPREWLSH